MEPEDISETETQADLEAQEAADELQAAKEKSAEDRRWLMAISRVLAEHLYTRIDAGISLALDVPPSVDGSRVAMARSGFAAMERLMDQVGR